MTSAGGGHAPPTGRITASNTSQTSSVPPDDDSVVIGWPFQFRICGMIPDANRFTDRRAAAGVTHYEREAKCVATAILRGAVVRPRGPLERAARRGRRC